MGRKHARESAMKLLYQMEINSDFSTNAIEVFYAHNKFNQGEKLYIDEAIGTIIENLKVIDGHIDSYIDGWQLNRLAKVDLSVLRIATYEMLYRDDIPIQVSINEAIEIAKKYSTDEASGFINGILGSLVRERDRDG
ncbi:MAG: transcription antitermination factor NusB [Tissierellia bacterium]|nr:transcription antitermination factor NusB [Tissierellia bacterium]